MGAVRSIKSGGEDVRGPMSGLLLTTDVMKVEACSAKGQNGTYQSVLAYHFLAIDLPK